MAALNLFPSRVRFVNADGTLTSEAYRALQIVFGRVGGSLGDSGVDTFTDSTMVGQSSENPSITDTVSQPFGDNMGAVETIQQPINWDVFLPDISQPASQDSIAPDVVQPDAIGINAAITSALLVGKTITVQNGLITGFA